MNSAEEYIRDMRLIVQILLYFVHSFSFNAEYTLHFHAVAPGPVLYRSAEARTRRLLSAAFLYIY